MTMVNKDIFLFIETYLIKQFQKNNNFNLIKECLNKKSVFIIDSQLIAKSYNKTKLLESLDKIIASPNIERYYYGFMKLIKLKVEDF